SARVGVFAAIEAGDPEPVATRRADPRPLGEAAGCVVATASLQAPPGASIGGCRAGEVGHEGVTAAVALPGCAGLTTIAQGDRDTQIGAAVVVVVQVLVYRDVGRPAAREAARPERAAVACGATVRFVQPHVAQAEVAQARRGDPGQRPLAGDRGQGAEQRGDVAVGA